MNFYTIEEYNAWGNEGSKEMEFIQQHFEIGNDEIEVLDKVIRKVRKERLFFSKEYYQTLVNQGYTPGFNPEQLVEEELANLVKFKIKRVSKESVDELKRKIDVVLEK